MLYKNLKAKIGHSEKSVRFNTPEGCFSSCVRSTFKIKEITKKKIDITMVNLKIDSLRLIQLIKLKFHLNYSYP